MRLTEADLAAARALELRQPVLRSRLAALLDSFITSGLYDDESSGDFAAFVAHVQKELSISPRTILLQQLNAKLAHLVDTRADASELHVLLGLPRGAPIARLADALEALGAGRAHARWSAAAAAGRKTSALAEPQLRAKIAGGLRAKAAARGEAALSEAAVAATLDRLEAEEEARRLRSAESAVELWDAVARDETYERWSRAHALWRSSGAERLWADFVELDRREGEERRARGGCFEDRAAACFALLVLRLQSEARPAAAFSYLRGAAWCDERSKLIGEIDLVVLCDEHGAAAEAAVAEAERLRARLHELQAAERSQGDGRSYRSSRRERAEAKLEALRRRIEEVEIEAERCQARADAEGPVVAAICEMKSGCFELAAAFHQHEPKLAAALAGGAGAPSIRATAAYREPPLRLPRAAAEVPIFVATLLPPHRYVVGAEPALTHAVCDSIREVSAGSTILEPQPDLAAVEAAVRLRMGGRLRESARGAVARCGERVVVLADEAELGAATAETATGAGTAARDALYEQSRRAIAL